MVEISGIRFYGMVEELRQSLHKKVEVLDIEELNTNEILPDSMLFRLIQISENSKNYQTTIREVMKRYHGMPCTV